MIVVQRLSLNKAQTISMFSVMVFYFYFAMLVSIFLNAYNVFIIRSGNWFTVFFCSI